MLKKGKKNKTKLVFWRLEALTSDTEVKKKKKKSFLAMLRGLKRKNHKCIQKCWQPLPQHEGEQQLQCWFLYTKRVQTPLTVNQTQSSSRRSVYSRSVSLFSIFFRSWVQVWKARRCAVKKHEINCEIEAWGLVVCSVGPFYSKPRRNKETFWLLSLLRVEDQHRHRYENNNVCIKPAVQLEV